MMPGMRFSSMLERVWESFVVFSDVALGPFIIARAAQLSTLWMLLVQFSAIVIRMWDGVILRYRATFLTLHSAPASSAGQVDDDGMMRHSAPANSASQADDHGMELRSTPAKMSSRNSETTDEELILRYRAAVKMQHSAPANSAGQVDNDGMMQHSAPAKMGSRTRSGGNSETTDEDPMKLLQCAIRIVDDPSGVPREHKDMKICSDSTSQASHDCGVYGDMTDEEFSELVRLVKSAYGLSEVLREHKVFLRIPDADPGDLGPDAEATLRSGVEAQLPGYTVTEITFQRGSLLVGIRVSSPRDAESQGNDDSSPQRLKEVSNNKWLSWLGLSADMVMSSEVDVPTDRRVNWFDGFPLAATVPNFEQDSATVSFPLKCSQFPQDVAFKASLGACVLECNVLVSPSDEGELNICPGAKQSYVSLQVRLLADALCGSPCHLLTVNVQSLTDHIIIGDKTVVLLLDDLTDMESDLCSLRLLHFSGDESQGLMFDLQKEHSGAHIAFVVGWWLQTMNIEHQRGDGGKELRAADSEHLDRMWRAGNCLLLHLVVNGCVSAAKHVVHVLLNFPAPSPLVRHGVERAGSDCTGGFYDYFGGDVNPRGRSMLHLAILSGCCAMVDEVLRWTQAYQLPSLGLVQDQFGMTPLHLAVLINEGEMAAYLLQKRCPVLLRAWHLNGGHAGSPKQFSQKMSGIRQDTGTAVVAHESTHSPHTSPPSRSTSPHIQADTLNTHPTAWFSLVNRLWASLEPWPHAEQQNKFIMFKLEQTSTALVLVSVLQSIGMLSIVRRGGLGLLSLHAVLVACVFTVPIACLVHKRDYLAAEKLILAWSLWRTVLVHHQHLTDSTSIVCTVMHMVRPIRAVLEPIRFQWTVAVHLGTLVLDCVIRNGNSIYRILFWHILGLTTAVAVEIRHRKQFLALDKSQ